MGYRSLEQCISDLETNDHLIRIKEEVDPNLLMAAIHLKVFERKGPAILFENVKGSKYQAVSNLFGTLDRSRFMFRDTLDSVKKLVELKGDPSAILKAPTKYVSCLIKARWALPSKKSNSKVSRFEEVSIADLPLIKCWPNDGGAFVTLPQVYSEDYYNPGIMKSNIGMYRIQLDGNEYKLNDEIGLHYQLHRGIGVHQTIANRMNKPLRVSIFVGGPPAHSFAAVMPLPEGISETTFAGFLSGRKFRYTYWEDYCISLDADFVIVGDVYPNENKPEGPFGDHLGYYSLTHEFPLMKVKKVFAKKNGIWPFTVVGRPPQEDTQFGALIHEITGSIIPKEIPGLHEVNAVDEAGVHPLLLTIGSERYTPYQSLAQPQEVLTIANHILGFGQMSLAKYLFIVNKSDDMALSTHNYLNYFKHVLERINWERDVHFYTNTTIDTLDYSGDSLNRGSKVVFAAVGAKKRELATSINAAFRLPNGFENPNVVLPGILAIQSNEQQIDQRKIDEIGQLNERLVDSFPLIILVDDASFTAKSIPNYLWVTYTRSNPSQDIYGVNSFIENKHWGCKGPLMIDARIKKHHAPVLELDPTIEKKAEDLVNNIMG
jgi:4-hydroxy-3-polyprenylbenzoate decarboxylase